MNAALERCSFWQLACCRLLVEAADEPSWSLQLQDREGSEQDREGSEQDSSVEVSLDNSDTSEAVEGFLVVPVEVCKIFLPVSEDIARCGCDHEDSKGSNL